MVAIAMPHVIILCRALNAAALPDSPAMALTARVSVRS